MIVSCMDQTNYIQIAHWAKTLHQIIQLSNVNSIQEIHVSPMPFFTEGRVNGRTDGWTFRIN